MKKFLKQLFCSHVDDLVEKKYLYSVGMRILGKFHPTSEHYALTFKCLKCERVRMEEINIDVLMSMRE